MPLIIDCSFCEARTQANQVKLKHNTYDEADIGVIDAAYECTSCNSLVATRFVYDIDDVRTGKYDAFSDLFSGYADPEPLLEYAARWWPRSSSMPAYRHTPKSVEPMVVEAYKCFDADCFSAAVLMARGAIESILKEHGFTEGPLAAKIKRMAASQALDPRTVEMCEAIKDHGNAVAHADVGVTYDENDARMLLKLLELVLTSVYENKALLEHVQRLAQTESTDRSVADT